MKVLSLVLLIWPCLSVVSLSADIRYRVTDLGPFTSGFSEAAALNNRGEVAGNSHARAFFWNGDMVPVGSLDYFVHATDINELGQVVGDASIAGAGSITAFLWRADSPIVGLGDLPGGRGSYAYAINNCGQVVGFSDAGPLMRPLRAFLWQDGAMHRLAGLPDGESLAFDINDHGQVVGWVQVPEGIRAFLWQDGAAVILRPLAGDAMSVAYQINNSGLVLGISGRQLVIWQDGIPTAIGPGDGRLVQRLHALNDRGQVVAPLKITGREDPAAIWQDGQWRFINDLLIPGTTIRVGWAADINERGQIAATSKTGYYGQQHALLLTPVYWVSVDIRPGEEPNVVNLASRGVLPVAVLSDAEFQAARIDPASVCLAEAPPARWTWEDVNDDGLTDLLLFFRTGNLPLAPDATEARLTGRTADGFDIEGVDSVRIVPQR